MVTIKSYLLSRLEYTTNHVIKKSRNSYMLGYFTVSSYELEGKNIKVYGKFLEGTGTFGGRDAYVYFNKTIRFKDGVSTQLYESRIHAIGRASKPVTGKRVLERNSFHFNLLKLISSKPKTLTVNGLDLFEDISRTIDDFVKTLNYREFRIDDINIKVLNGSQYSFKFVVILSGSLIKVIQEDETTFSTKETPCSFKLMLGDDIYKVVNLSSPIGLEEFPMCPFVTQLGLLLSNILKEVGNVYYLNETGIGTLKERLVTLT